MKKVKLNLNDFQENSKRVSDFLSKKTMSNIVGGKLPELDFDVPPSYCDSCYVRK